MSNILEKESESNFEEKIEKPFFRIQKVALLREEGVNGDRELAAAFIYAGFVVHDLTVTDLAVREASLDDFVGLVFPGGFSYAGNDYTLE